MIQISNLNVSAEETQILKNVEISFELGKNYCLLGKNGSGKSTLSSVLMGHPAYEVQSGDITVDGKDLLEMEPDERSKAGIFLSFQHIPEIIGVKLSEYLRTIYNISSRESVEGFTDLSPFMFKRFIKSYLDELEIDPGFLDRDLNVGFSGGEKRKIEILQMKLIGPKYIILDEVDSGLDLDAFRKVASMLSELSNENNCIIIITHYFTILDYIDVDEVIVMKKGEIVERGGKDLATRISQSGFEDL